MHYTETPAKVRSPAMLWLVGFISALNVALAGVLLWRGFNFWPDNPDGADPWTVAACVVTMVLAALWAVAALREYYGPGAGDLWR